MNVLMFCLGLIFGGLIIWWFLQLGMRKYYAGVLVVDHSDPFDGPYLFLEIEKEVNIIEKQRYVFLKVRNEDLAPRK